MRVLYVQPYVAEYRVPLYDELAKRLAESGGSLLVASSPPKGRDRLRGDMATAPWNVPVRAYSLATPLGELKYRWGLGKLLRSVDLCVMELDAGNLNAWLHLLRRHHVPLVLWGHGRSYVGSSSRSAERLKAWQTRLSRHTMTYTESGRQHLVRHGARPDQVTSVGNSTDTKALQRLLNARYNRPLTRSEVFGLDVADRNVACYVGSLDQDKRVSFVVEAAHHAHLIDPHFLLLIAGSGADQRLLERGISGGYIAWTPRADRRQLADIEAISRCLWMPGRVGLVAIDALAAAIPVLTTAFPYHAPEIELLRLGENLFVLEDQPLGFAQHALRVMARCSSGRSASTWEVPDIGSVAESMLSVISGATDG